VAVAIITRARFAGAIVVVLGVVALAAWLQVRAGARAVSVRRVFQDRAFVGDVVAITVEVVNASRWPQPAVHMRDAKPTDLVAVPRAAPDAVLSIPGRGTAVFEYRLIPGRRGYHRLGPATVSVTDALRLESRAATAPPDDRLIVYPEIISMDALGLPARGPVADLASPRALLEDAARFSNLRPYVLGEDARKIHWPASARTGSIIARQPETAQSRDTIICLDLGRPSYAAGWQGSVELSIVAGASIAHHVVVRDDLEVGLNVHGYDLASRAPAVGVPVGRGLGHLMVILETLARVASVPEAGFGAVIDEALHDAPFGSTVLAVTGRLDGDLLGRLHLARRRGHAAAVVVVGDRTVRAGRFDGVPVFSVPERAAMGAIR
jgi:uncharacterized protein (DUF58 family)